MMSVRDKGRPWFNGVGIAYACFMGLVHATQTLAIEASGGGTFGTSSSPQKSLPVPYGAGITYTPQAPALRDDNYQMCGQDCLLQRAIENLSLQAAFVLKKIGFLLSDEVSDQAKAQVLGSFMKPNEKVSSAVHRYVADNRFWFVKVRGAIGKNLKSYNEYHCAEFSPDHSRCIRSVSNDQNYAYITLSDPEKLKEQEKLSQVTFLPKYDFLKTMKPEASQLAQVQDGVAEIQSFQPQKDDFILFKTIPKDPSHPEAGTYEVPVTDSKGKNVYDEAAYKRAMEDWGRMAMDLKDMQSDPKTRMKQKMQDLQAFRKEDPRKENQAGNQNYKRMLYNNARGEYVDEVNGFVAQTHARTKARPNLDPISSRTNSQGLNIDGQTKAAHDPNRIYNGNEEVRIPQDSNSGGAKNMNSSTVYYSPNAFSRDFDQGQDQQPKQGGHTLPKSNDDNDIDNPFF